MATALKTAVEATEQYKLDKLRELVLKILPKSPDLKLEVISGRFVGVLPADHQEKCQANFDPEESELLPSKKPGVDEGSFRKRILCSKDSSKKLLIVDLSKGIFYTRYSCSPAKCKEKVVGFASMVKCIEPILDKGEWQIIPPKGSYGSDGAPSFA